MEHRDDMRPEGKHLTLRELCTVGDPAKKYKKMVKIGEGSFGLVFMGIDSETKQKVAIKKMAITKKNKYHLETELVRDNDNITHLL